jgi:peptide/nickel transport system substrate-binding protein
MSAYSRFAEWLRTLFFWHTPSGSHEFKAETHQDHALVLAVTEPKRVPRYQQLRFLHRVLTSEERLVLWGAFVVGLVSTGIGVYALLTPHMTTAPAVGGTFTEALVGTPKRLNPLFAPTNDVDRDLVSLIYSGLFRMNADLNPMPDLAETYRWIDDRNFEIRLRKDARFHDGTSVTADDVVFTYQTVRLPSWHSPLQQTYAGLRVVRVDDTTVQFQLDKPNPTLLTDLTLGILPAHIWEDVPDSSAQLADANLRPIGSGPYRVDAFTRDAKGALYSYRLKRFDSYYGFKPFIETRQFRFYPDQDQATAALQSNQVDALAFLPWSTAKQQKNANLHLVPIELPQETMAFFNLRDPLLKDLKLRRALAAAIDRSELQTLVGEEGVVADTPFPYLETTSTAVTSSLELARAALDKLGWTMPTGSTIRTKAPTPPAAPTTRTGSTAPKPTPAPSASSTPLAFDITVADQPDLITIAEYLKRRWSLVGASVNVKTVDPDTLRRDAKTFRDFQVLVYNILPPPDEDVSGIWASDYTAYGYNFSGLADRDVDTALDQLLAASTTQSILAGRRNVTALLQDRLPALFLLRPRYAELVSNRIQGVGPMRLAEPAGRFDAGAEWYIETSRKWR